MVKFVIDIARQGKNAVYTRRQPVEHFRESSVLYGHASSALPSAMSSARGFSTPAPTVVVAANYIWNLVTSCVGKSKFMLYPVWFSQTKYISLVESPSC